jgi:hypothetical protein
MGKSATAPQAHVKKGKASGLKKLIRETQSSDSDEDIGHSAPTAPLDSAKPWRADFMNYMDTLEAKPPPGMSIIQWWGVCAHLPSLLRLILILLEDQCTEVWARVDIDRSRLFVYNGIICLERASFFPRWDNHQQTPQSA